MANIETVPNAHSEINKFANEVAKLDRVTEVKVFMDGISVDVYVEGEPVYVEYEGPNFRRVDFGFDVDLGNTPVEAANGFLGMINTDIEELIATHGR